MNVQFHATDQQEKEFQQLTQKVATIKQALSPYMDDRDAENIDRLSRDIQTKLDKFRREDRKLTLAVVGRVKAGKSSFLNELIFQGKDILPHAFRPKTATLTKIEYDAHPHMTITYYRPVEWEQLEKLAKQESSTREDVKTAKELVNDVKNSGLDVKPYLAKGQEIIDMPDEAQMESVLDTYVGANGQLTPIVKSVTLCINRPELEGLSIVDTPGTNDPIVSRTQATKDFLAECDIIFFLTPASQALDRQDIDLLQTQLPGQGVADIRLIASRFDEVVLDASYDYGSLKETIKKEKDKFSKDTKAKFTRYADEYTQSGRPNLGKLMRSCMNPYFLSSLMHRMSQKTKSQYTSQEENSFMNLDDAHGDMTTELVAQLGDMSAIENEFKNILAHKDEKLAASLQQTLPTFQRNLQTVLENLLKKARQHRLTLESHDQKEILVQKQAIADQILKLKGHVGDQFSQVMCDMESAKVALVGALHNLAANRDMVVERTGTETHQGTRTISDSHWYNPFSWFSSHEESYTYDTHYKYIDTSDALESLRRYAHQIQQTTDSRMADSIDLKGLKGHLLQAIVNNMDTSSNDFNPDQLRLIVQDTLNQIELPVFQVSLDKYINDITDHFSGEVRDTNDREQLKQVVSQVASDLIGALIQQIAAEVKSFKEKLGQLQEQFVDILLKDVNAEFENLEKQASEKGKSIQRLKEYEDLLTNYAKE